MARVDAKRIERARFETARKDRNTRLKDILGKYPSLSNYILTDMVANDGTVAVNISGEQYRLSLDGLEILGKRSGVKK